ncbi:glycoside hydrolase family 6 protein [Amycolatopsis aidingensis]|uniref:glycoside hydrolase family 6 protein n=1 Tax=Amycolatopsis aidingensis TaxID=2842453 RepID=UPI001E40A87E|nr:glycoside hydrolase family 6 protein [Amycolatopsis aidingensis]
MAWTVRRAAILLSLLTLLMATTTPVAAANPIEATNGFYVYPGSAPATWVRSNPDDPRAARISAEIGDRPIARWFGNASDIGSVVASHVGRAHSHGLLPVLVAYNLPGRDACGGHSGGGAGSVGAYRTWIASFAAGIGDRPAVVVIEPDALGDFACMDDTAIEERLGMLRYATEKFMQKAPNTWAYLDGGNVGWVAAGTMADRLDAAGVRNIRGFAVNVSNYYTTAASLDYAGSVNAALGYSAGFVVDTSRNGHGSNGQWCNPPGRKLGTSPQVGGGADMLLWVKTPGNSDGECGIAPDTPAGQFDPELADRLIDGS